MALTREANEDQVEVPRVNDQGDRYIPGHFASKNGGQEPKGEHQRSMRYWHPNFLPVFTKSARHLKW